MWTILCPKETSANFPTPENNAYTLFSQCLHASAFGAQNTRFVKLYSFSQKAKHFNGK